MDKKQAQIIKSILAIVCCIAFLWTGKKFIWNKEETKASGTEQSGSTPVAEVTDITTSTTLAESTTTEAVTTTALESSTTEVLTSTSAEQTSAAPVSTTAATSSAAVSESAPVVTVTAPAESDSGVPHVAGLTAAPEGYFNDALFIGDSRMVGLACFAPINGATYFASTGLSSFKIDSAESEIEGNSEYNNPSTKGMKLDAVMKMKQFSKVYLMLGINELGCDRGVAKEKYMDVYLKIRNTFPNATIYIMANLHVSHKRADHDSYVNNKEINDYNSYLETLADNNVSYYLDENPLFDAADGYLKEELTNDGVHPFAKHYSIWRDFLMQNVAVK